MTIYIPTPLRSYAGGKDAIEITAPTISDALDALTETYPELRKHLFTGDGKLRAFVNLYLNDEDVRYLPQKEQSECRRKRYVVDHPIDRRRSIGTVSTVQGE